MINLFKSFFARIGTFIINTVKKVGKIVIDHFNPKANLKTGENLLAHSMITAGVVIGLYMIHPVTTIGRVMTLMAYLAYFSIGILQTTYTRDSKFTLNGIKVTLKEGINNRYESKKRSYCDLVDTMIPTSNTCAEVN